MKHDQAHIDKLRTEIERKVNWGPVSQWHSSMFDELSDLILQSTDVMLSKATLKRFFGVVNHKGNPSITTLDTLCAFVDKQNWRVFKQSAPPPKFSITKNLSKNLSGKSIYITFGFVLAFIMIMLFSNKRPDIIINANEVAFSSRPVGTEYPNSVVFDFQLPKLRTDSLHIQQSWDRRRTVKIAQGQTQATGIYYFPGYFRAKLMVEGKIIKEHDLFLKSYGWLGTIEYEPVPKYFPPKITDHTSLSYPIELETEIKASKEPLELVYHYVNDLGDISGDNFSLSARIQNTYAEKWAVCQQLRIYLLGTEGAMIVPFSKIGCTSDINLMLNDTYLDGKKHDLSALNADFSEAKDLQIEVKDKNVSIYIENQKVYTQGYNESMGKLVGVRFKFQGLGEVRDLRLLDGEGEQIVLN